MFSFSNYSLSLQLLAINLLIIIIGLIFLILFNFYLISSDENIKSRNKLIEEDLKNITDYLESNSILRVPFFQYDYRCRYSENEECIKQNNNNSFELSEPLLDRFSAEQFIIKNYSNKDYNIKIFNDNWIKIADSNTLFLSTDVNETEILETKKIRNFSYNTYKDRYYDIFSSVQTSYLNNKFTKKAEYYLHDINLVSETIKKKNIVQKIFKDKYDNLFKTISSPIIFNKKIYGVAIIKYNLLNISGKIVLTSINLFNFFLILIFVMFVISFFFLRSLISPLTQLTNITNLEREKIRSGKKINYPKRGDEIGTLSKQIQIMSRDFKSQVLSLEKFTTDVAHELKNPLTAIKSSSELLLKNTISEENKIKLIESFNKEVNRMNRLISDISNFSRTMYEIESERFKVIDINYFLKKYVDNYLGNYKNIKLILASQKSKYNVSLNEDKFMQVLLNIIENSVSIANSNTSILISTSKIDKKNVVIKIYDQGKGISLEHKNKIFTRFYTDRDKLRENHSGLGLSISEEIIKSFNGSIELTKSDNLDFRGACFIIKLPLWIS